MTVYYNEFDPKAAAWLREMIKNGHIADGVVDERSIEDVAPSDLAGFTQHHFFAGIGIWSYALRRAGWPDDRPVWTGSCPCQPFSAAGKGVGFADERHLWPHWHWLIEQCRPDDIYGEQVASKDGLGWLDLVCSDMEGTGYSIRAADLCAAGFGAPHIRQRLFWNAQSLEHAAGIRRQQWRAEPSGRGIIGGCGPDRLADAEHNDGWSDITRRGSDRGTIDGGRGGPMRLADADGTGSLPRTLPGIHCVEESAGSRDVELERSGAVVRMVNADGAGREGHGQSGNINVPAGWPIAGRHSAAAGVDGGLADANRDGCGAGDQLRSDGQEHDVEHGGGAVRPGPVNGAWSNADWLLCRDAKWRPVESGTFPLAHGAAERVGLLRGYGNAIVAQVAEGFINATR